MGEADRDRDSETVVNTDTERGSGRVHMCL